MPKAADRAAVRALLLVTALVVAQAASADTRTLYKWVDRDGKQQYSDKPPVGFKGEVMRIEMELDTPPAAEPARPKASPIPADVMRDVAPPPPDMAKARREKRERLDAAVRQAREKVAAAQAALDGGGEPKDDEHQMIQRQYAKAQAGRSNCRTVVDAAGKKAIVCPSMIPNDEYYERIRGLEEALRKAEEELSDAEAAYRRGVD